jgi:hypothetical protein
MRPEFLFKSTFEGNAEQKSSCLGRNILKAKYHQSLLSFEGLSLMAFVVKCEFCEKAVPTLVCFTCAPSFLLCEACDVVLHSHNRSHKTSALQRPPPTQVNPPAADVTRVEPVAKLQVPMSSAVEKPSPREQIDAGAKSFGGFDVGPKRTHQPDPSASVKTPPASALLKEDKRLRQPDRALAQSNRDELEPPPRPKPIGRTSPKESHRNALDASIKEPPRASIEPPFGNFLSVQRGAPVEVRLLSKRAHRRVFLHTRDVDPLRDGGALAVVPRSMENVSHPSAACQLTSQLLDIATRLLKLPSAARRVYDAESRRPVSDVSEISEGSHLIVTCGEALRSVSAQRASSRANDHPPDEERPRTARGGGGEDARDIRRTFVAAPSVDDAALLASRSAAVVASKKAIGEGTPSKGEAARRPPEKSRRSDAKKGEAVGLSEAERQIIDSYAAVLLKEPPK